MVGIDASPPQMQFFRMCLNLRLVLVVEVDKENLLLLEVALNQIEHEGQWQKLKGIDFVMLAVLIDVFKEIFLVGELLVVFEVVEGLAKDAVIDAVLILVAFVGLLPAQVDEHLFAVLHLAPASPDG
jgi:hypothetical protein